MGELFFHKVLSMKLQNPNMHGFKDMAGVKKCDERTHK